MNYTRIDNKPNLILLLRYFVAFIAGVLIVLSFEPFNQWYFAYVSIIAIFWISPKMKFRQLLGVYYIYGLAAWGFSSYWLVSAFYTNGSASLTLSIGFTFFIIATLALYSVLKITIYSIVVYLNSELSKSKAVSLQVTKICLFASCWVLVDWLQGNLLFGGQSNLYLSYGQVNTILSGYFPLVGDLGVTWIIVFLSGIAYLILNSILCKNLKHIVIYFVIIFSLLGCAFILKNFTWTIPGKNLSRIVLVQGNTPPIKDYANSEANIRTYEKLTQPYWNKKNNDLVVIWPEGVIGKMLPGAKEVIKLWHHKSSNSGITLITGIPNKIDYGKDYYLLSSIIALGEGNGFSYKNHLVPWGEYIPLKGFFNFLKFYDSSITKYVTGQSIGHSPVLLQTPHMKLAPLICFDINYQNYVLKLAKESDVLLTISNNSWFGDTIQAWQYLQIAQTRALETQRYHLLATNDGVTAIITPFGNITKMLPRFVSQVLEGDITAHVGSTPLMLIGGSKTIALMCLFNLLFLLILGIVARQSTKNNT